MAYQSIGLGSTADDGTGDTLRVGGTKLNANFVELYTLLGDASDLSSGISATSSVITLTAPTISGVVGGTQTSATITTLTTTTVTASGVITGSTVEATGDTSASDNAAIGYTSAEGLILTGQGSTDDITLKNDADTTVLNIATGATDVEVSAGNILFGTANKGVYLGVTSATAANLLDDYETGTWTPTFVSTSATFAYTTQGGTYTKVGRICTASFRLEVSGAPGGTTSNSLTIGGLPFAIATLADSYHGGHPGFYFNINLTQPGSMAYQLASGASTVELKNIGDNIGQTAVVASNLGSAAEIRGQIVYQTA